MGKWDVNCWNWDFQFRRINGELIEQVDELYSIACSQSISHFVDKKNKKLVLILKILSKLKTVI